jgi:hypothetical protein
MLLIQHTAMAFADTTRALFDAIATDPERENPEPPEGGGESTRGS